VADLILIGGGKEREDESMVYGFSTESNKWQMFNSVGESPPIQLIGHSCITFNKKLYTFGGQVDGVYIKQMYILDLTKQKAPLTPRKPKIFKEEDWNKNYLQLKKIGRGGFSTVLKVKSKSDGRVYAAKRTVLNK
jgi:N-acetylneuraminic acid mutarotase